MDWIAILLAVGLASSGLVVVAGYGMMRDDPRVHFQRRCIELQLIFLSFTLAFAVALVAWVL